MRCVVNLEQIFIILAQNNPSSEIAVKHIDVYNK